MIKQYLGVKFLLLRTMKTKLRSLGFAHSVQVKSFARK